MFGLSIRKVDELPVQDWKQGRVPSLIILNPKRWLSAKITRFRQAFSLLCILSAQPTRRFAGAGGASLVVFHCHIYKFVTERQAPDESVSWWFLIPICLYISLSKLSCENACLDLTAKLIWASPTAAPFFHRGQRPQLFVSLSGVFQIQRLTKFVEDRTRQKHVLVVVVQVVELNVHVFQAAS